MSVIFVCDKCGTHLDECNSVHVEASRIDIGKRVSVWLHLCDKCLIEFDSVVQAFSRTFWADATIGEPNKT